MRNNISYVKRIKIKSAELSSSSDQGKYFNIKNKTVGKNLISNVRYTTPSDYYSESIEELGKSSHTSIYLLASKKKRETKDLDSPRLIPIDFDREFAWAKAILSGSLKDLEMFLELSKEFSNRLLLGNIKSAGDTLDKIENKFGASLWLIKNKIAFLQLSEGLESQKKYTSSIKTQLRSGNLPRFIIHWVSVRNESQTSATRFLSQVESTIAKINPKNHIGFREYIRYHLLGIDSFQAEDFINVLRLEYSCSIIDYYEAFISLLRILSISAEIKLRSKVARLLQNKKFVINDSRIQSLKLLFDEPSSISNDERHLIEPYDKYFQGDYKGSYEQANKYLEVNSDNPILLIVAAQAKAMLDADTDTPPESNTPSAPLKEVILNSLRLVIDKGAVNSSKEFNELSKIYLNFSCFPWTSAISLIIENETSMFPKADRGSTLLALRIPTLHPVLLQYFDDEHLFDMYRNACSKRYSISLSFHYFSSLRLEKGDLAYEGLSTDSRDLLLGMLKYKNGNYQDAVDCAQGLINSNSSYLKRRGYGLLSYAYLRLNDLKMSCITSCDCYIKERAYYQFLPLGEILAKTKSGTEEWRSVNSLIDLPIILDAFVKNISKSLEIERAFAYEDFLEKNGISKPSQITDQISKFPIEKLIYYLRYVCVESTMDTSSAFEGGSQEVVEERLSICRVLLALDPTNEDAYKQEIGGLVRKQVLTNRRQEVDQSRIYVDIQSIKEWANSEVKENYNRYNAYIKTGLDVNENSKSKNNEKPDSADELQSISGIKVPENEVNALLWFMVEEITDAYLGPDFGLDRFLSTRIRHGILEGHLRRPIQNHNLITKKEFKNGPYLRNEFWLKKLKANPSLQKVFDKALVKFSESYDRLISNINELLKIKRANGQKGLFNFIIHDQDIKEISALISREDTCEEFVDLVISALENRLIFNLLVVRNELNNSEKSGAKKLLNELQEATSSHGNSTALELQGSINQARTDLQSQFDKVIEWFVPPSSGNSAPYEIDDAMMVAEAIIKETNPDFKVNVISKKDEQLPIHGQLPIFVDIFVNIFENVVKRSGLDTPEADADIEIWDDGVTPEITILQFKITNRLGAGIDSTNLESECKRKKHLLQNESYSQYLVTEKNSGLFKIHKSVHDFKIRGYEHYKPTMDFGIENDLFQVTITVPFRLFTIDEQPKPELI